MPSPQSSVSDVIVAVASVQPPVAVTVNGADPLVGETPTPHSGPLWAATLIVNPRHSSKKKAKRRARVATHHRMADELGRAAEVIGTVLLEEFRWKRRDSGLLDRSKAGSKLRSKQVLTISPNRLKRPTTQWLRAHAGLEARPQNWDGRVRRETVPGGNLLRWR